MSDFLGEYVDFGGIHVAHFAGAGEAVPAISDRGETVDDSAFLVGGDKKWNFSAH